MSDDDDALELSSACPTLEVGNPQPITLDGTVQSRLARLEAAAAVLVERELLRRNPMGPYYDPIRRSDAEDEALEWFMNGLLAMSPKDGGA